MGGGGGAEGVVGGVRNRRGLRGRRGWAERRGCAARALGRGGSDPARRALEKANKVEDPVVRSAVNKALRGEGEES